MRPSQDSWDEALFAAMPLGPNASPLAQALHIGRAARRLESGADLGQLIEAAPLYNAGIRYYQGSPAESGTWDDSCVWVPIDQIPAYLLGPAFTNFAGRLISRLDAAASFTHIRRKYLENLLFHPLQNVLEHASGAVVDGRKGFAGMAARLTATLQPTVQSIQDYQRVVGAEEEFLEIVIIDGGDGIAQHFFQSKNPGRPSVLEGNPAREWLWLKNAFERHATSKYFERTADAQAYSPGVGLAAMLSALRFLHGFADIRCGRVHAYQYFMPAEPLSRSSLLLPDFQPAVEERIRGTIIRLAVPLLPRGAR